MRLQRNLAYPPPASNSVGYAPRLRTQVPIADLRLTFAPCSFRAGVFQLDGPILHLDHDIDPWGSGGLTKGRH